MSAVIPLSIRAQVQIPQNVRIGLEYKYKNVDQIPITNTQIVMGYEVNGHWVEGALLSSNTGFVARVSNQYYLTTQQNFATYTEASEFAILFRAYTVPVVPVSLGSGIWTLYAGPYSTQEEAAVGAQFINTNIPTMDVANVNTSRRQIAVIDQETVVLLIDSPELFPQFAPQGIDNQIPILSLENRKYRGRIEIGRYTGEKLSAVNVISLDEYLYGVVPSEMPASWHKEALKAQAVAARNYAIMNLTKHRNQGYDLCDNIHCQEYKGFTNEHPNTNQAVQETIGKFLYYDNKLVSTPYSSSSGGYTEDSENVWLNMFPYLRGVPDPYETTVKSWVRTFALEDIQKVLVERSKDIGEVKDVQVVQYTKGGRANEIKFIGTKGEYVIKKEDIRYFFKPLGGSLESRMLQIVKGEGSTFITVIGEGQTPTTKELKNLSVLGATGTIQSITAQQKQVAVIGEKTLQTYSLLGAPQGSVIFHIKGWGHGVGMSQYGAKGMAEQGFTYEQILSYYYTGTIVR